MVWTLLQVSVAVLLDNFVAETARSQEEEDSLRELKRSKIQVNHVLDPLLTRFVQARLLNRLLVVHALTTTHKTFTHSYAHTLSQASARVLRTLTHNYCHKGKINNCCQLLSHRQK